MASRPVKRRRVMSNGIPSTPHPVMNQVKSEDYNTSVHTNGGSFSDSNDSDDSNAASGNSNGVNGAQHTSQSSSSFQGFSDNKDVSDEQEVSTDEDLGSDSNSYEISDVSDEQPTKVRESGDVTRREHVKSDISKQRSGSLEQFTGSTATNILKLQCDELLHRVRPRKSGVIDAADSMLRRLKNLVENVPDSEILSFDEAEKLLKKSKIVYPYPKSLASRNSNLKLKYLKPSNINVIGSYALKTIVRQNEPITVDFVVEMPSSLFTNKDYLDHRYFQKRAFYVAWIAASLRQRLASEVKLTIENLNGNIFKPILVLEPKGEDRKEYAIQIIPYVQSSTFDSAKLSASRCSIRRDGADMPSTPFYNASILEDCNMIEFHKYLYSAQSRSKAFRQACILGRIWLRQRGFDSTTRNGGFGHFEWAALMASLLEGKSRGKKSFLSTTYDELQMFKATLSFLAQENLVPVSSSENHSKNHGVPILYDEQHVMNTLYKMSSWSYRQLRNEAHTTIKTLRTNSSSAFESTFILKISEPRLRYDLLIQMPVAAISSTKSEAEAPSSQEKYQNLYELLVRGLGDRVTTINMLLPAPSVSTISSSDAVGDIERLVTIAITINPFAASRLVDRGPAAEEKAKSDEFREFWGSKAELRRFKDGQILHSVVWENGSVSSIFEQISRHLLATHISTTAASLWRFVGGDREISKLSQVQSPQMSDRSESMMTAYRNLERKLRALEGLPLEIRQIQPSSPLLSYTWTAPANHAHILRHADVILQLESSGRWPDDLVAIQATKTAFLLKIAELLKDDSGSTTARVGLENRDVPYLNKSFIAITYAISSARENQAISFRLRIHHDREQHLLSQLLATNNPLKPITPTARTAAAYALANYKRTFNITPLHTAAVAALSTRLPAYAPTVRLLKSWFSSHHLSLHFCPQLIELFAARVFLSPEPWQTPGTASTGFLRAILFLSRWDWAREPLIVDFSVAAGDASGSGSTREKRDSLQKRFDAWRHLDPRMQRVAVFAGSDIDGDDGTTWTSSSGGSDGAATPGVVVANRMVALASAAMSLVTKKGVDLHLPSIFQSSVKEFDFVLKIAPKFTAAGAAVVEKKQKFKNLEMAAADQELVGYDPVEMYVEELQEVFRDAVVFFYGGNGSEIIAGLWNPEVTAKRRWKTNLGYSSIPVKAENYGTENGEDAQEEDDVDDREKVMAVPNKKAMIADMVRIGDDMIAGVDIHN